MFVSAVRQAGRSRRRQRKLHASSQRRRLVRQSQRRQHDRQPVPPTRQETQSEAEEVTQQLGGQTDRCSVSQFSSQRKRPGMNPPIRSRALVSSASGANVDRLLFLTFFCIEDSEVIL